MKNFVFTRFASAVCFVIFAAYGFYQMRVNTDYSKGKSDLASTSTDFETPESCGPERNYLQKDLAQISDAFRTTRKEIPAGQAPRQCVTYIMKNFMPLTTPMSFRSQCRDEKGNALSSPIRKFGDKGFESPCVTETYVNSVYNAMIDVADCFNVPMKELLPKLFNESGLHINSLGGGFDAGVGQLTSGALKQDVFERFNGEEKNPSGFEWYVNEMKKSDKASCKRIVAVPVAYTFNIPKGQKLCSTEAAATDPTCYKVWDSSNRCEFIAPPANPLRNVLTMAMLYRNNLRNVTGVNFSAGQDVMNGEPFTAGMKFGGYFSKGDYVERFRRLGATHADQEVIKQMFMGLGFNAGISAPREFLNDYLKQREDSGIKLSDSDVNFQDTDTGKWAVITNAPTFWKGLANADEYDSASKSLDVLGELKLDAKSAQNTYRNLRSEVKSALANLEKQKLPHAQEDAAVLALKTKYDQYRQKMLASVYPKAGRLTLPEFMRIAHAYKISTDRRVGGAPGYLSFLATKYKTLEKDMGSGVCSPEKYLKF